MSILPRTAERQPEPAGLTDRVQALLERMARIAYVRDQHRIAIARLSRQLAEAQSEIERLEARP